MFDVHTLIRDTFVVAVEQNEEIGSTSDRALELCHAGVFDLPMLILAERQTAGRGRGAAKWWAADGALTFTLILDPAAIDAPESRLSAVPLAMAAAIVAATEPFVAETADRLWVKWPNDVYAGERKLAGVLTESPAVAGPARLLVGVGVNVNNRSADAPAELRDQVVSVSDLRLCPLADEQRQALLVGLLNAFADRLDDFTEGFAAPPCPLDGQLVRVDTPAGTLRGEYVGVDDSGALLLRVDGKLERVVSGAGLRPIQDRLDNV